MADGASVNGDVVGDVVGQDQAKAFVTGMREVIDPQWLQMFSEPELQVGLLLRDTRFFSPKAFGGGRGLGVLRVLFFVRVSEISGCFSSGVVLSTYTPVSLIICC